MLFFLEYLRFLRNLGSICKHKHRPKEMVKGGIKKLVRITKRALLTGSTVKLSKIIVVHLITNNRSTTRSKVVYLLR